MIERHPLAELFPPMSPEEFGGLRDSIARDGLLEPLVLLDGKILDGANRARACEELRITPTTVDFTGTDPLAFVLAKNLARRHLGASQRSMVAGRLATMRQGARTDVEPRTNSSEVSNAEAAKLLNVGTTAVKEAKTVLSDGSPDLIAAVESGSIPVSVAKDLAALPEQEQITIVKEPNAKERRIKLKAGQVRGKQAAKEKRATKDTETPLVLEQQQAKRKDEPGSFSVETWKALKVRDRETMIERGFAVADAKLNEQTSDSIEWARFSLNVVTGCLHDCPYCYARDIAERLFPYGFTPMFHPSRLSGPQNTTLPAEAKDDTSFRNIFANSMSDLFGRWVPSEWIEANIEMARRNPLWNFLVLTKFPQRAVEFSFPENWWMGTTVDAQARVEHAEASMTKIQCKTKWLSVEPLLEPLRFKNLKAFQWLVIGGASESRRTPAWVPPLDWMVSLHSMARDAGLRVYYKTNAGMLDALRVREFPWGDAKAKALPKPFRYLKGM